MQILQIKNKSYQDYKQSLIAYFQTILARFKYGKVTIYDGDIFYIPHILVKVPLKQELCFLASLVSQEIIYLDKKEIITTDQEINSKFFLSEKRSEDNALELLHRKLLLNKKIKKEISFSSLKLSAAPIKVYIPSYSFYVKAKVNDLFIVDGITAKVDFKHKQAVAEHFLRYNNAIPKI